jgi:3-oxoacyl-[acyl-carrier-protein] synthase II
MVAGGAEAAISPLGIVSFQNMKALSRDNDTPESASKPFDLNRNGFVMGEGCGLVVLEELEHAKKRGARIYAEMVGYGMSGDAHHITAPAPEGEGGQRCMSLALQSGRISPDQITYINAHGTSTKLNDHYETLAVQKVFGAHADKLAISSTKGVTGHCLGAAGGIEGVFTALAVHHNLVPPTANLKTPDPECPLDYTASGAREMKVQYALSNSFGFGGTNGTIIFKKFS